MALDSYNANAARRILVGRIFPRTPGSGMPDDFKTLEPDILREQPPLATVPINDWPRDENIRRRRKIKIDDGHLGFAGGAVQQHPGTERVDFWKHDVALLENSSSGLQLRSIPLCTFALGRSYSQLR